MVRPVLIDVDTGIDDALALLYAVAHPDLDLIGVSCVAGNSPLPQVVTNTLKVLDAVNASAVPVAAGASRPLREAARRTAQPHGLDGLGGVALPPPSRTASGNAIEMLRHAIMTAKEPVTLVALAPQTNLALLLSHHPEVTDRLAGIVFVGGWADPAHAHQPEVNVGQDPAAAAVIASDVPVTMYSMEVFTRLTVAESLVQRLTTHQNSAVRLVGELLVRRAAHDPERSGLIGDAGALVFLTDPDLFTVRPATTLAIVLDVNAEAAAETFVATLERYR